MYAFPLQKYVADNKVVPFVSPHTGRAYKGGYGGLLKSDRVYAAATVRVARKIRAAIAVSAILAEGKALGASIKPGHVTATFARPKISRVQNNYKLKTGRVNPRWAARIEVYGEEGESKRDADGFAYDLQSDPIVLEAGSDYNEGSRTSRPALRVMANAARSVGLANAGVRVRVSK